MKKIEKEVTREIKEKFEGWEAQDGTFFDRQDECRRYEESALGVLRGRVKDYIVGEPKDAWNLMGGCDDHTVTAFSLPTEEAVGTFLQFLFLECPWYLNDIHVERKEEVENIIYTAYEDKDLILMGKNCDGDYYFINSRQHIIDNLNNIGKKDE